MAHKYLRVDVNDNSPESIDSEPIDFHSDFGIPRSRTSLEAAGPEHASAHDELEDFVFVDLHEVRRQQPDLGRWGPERLREAVQRRKNHLAGSRFVLFRWPWLALNSEERHDCQISAWLDSLIGDNPGEGVLSGSVTEIGVVQHCVGDEPIICWAGSEPDAGLGVLDAARAIETAALIMRGNAYWKPSRYHYILPSGEHTDRFVRIGDALRTPHDAYAMACWLTPCLTDDVAIVSDTAGLNALLIQLEEILARAGSAASHTVVLPEYEVSKPAVRRLLERAATGSTRRFLGVQSVNSTGSLRELLAGELARVSDGRLGWTLDVLVDRSPVAVAQLFSETEHSQHSQIWLDLSLREGQSKFGSCSLCNASDKPQPVHINPRNYREVVLPEPSLAMPAIDYAVEAQTFWTRVSHTKGIAIEARPHPGSLEARGKHQRLPVRPFFELIAEPDGLEEFVRERIASLRRSAASDRNATDRWKFDDIGLVVANQIDVVTAARPEFAGQGDVDLNASARIVLGCLGIEDHVPLLACTAGSQTDTSNAEIAHHVKRLNSDEAILLFSWGAVTGLNLRLLKMRVSQALDATGASNPMRGVVFHSRPAHPSDWEATVNSFKPSRSEPSRLGTLWTSSFPWSSPLVDEYLLLDRIDFDSIEISDDARTFLEERKRFLRFPETYGGGEDDWSPRFKNADAKIGPGHVFWGMSVDEVHQSAVRGQSLYGNRLDPMTAYAAIGSTINYTRHSAGIASAPRWIRFDMARIVHSYYDAIIICSILRWLKPGEISWDSEPADAANAANAMRFLIEQVEDSPEEKIILLPELLLADAQGKIPDSGREVLRDTARSAIQAVASQAGGAIGRGALEIGLALAERP